MRFCHKFVWLPVAAGLALLTAGPVTGAAHARDAVEVTKEQPYAKLFDDVVKTTSENFYSREILRRTDWEQRAKAARPGVLKSKNLNEAVARINALLAELKTSHTALYTPGQHQYYTLLDIVELKTDPTSFTPRMFWADTVHYAGIGIFTSEKEGRHFVDGVMEGSPAARAGILYGDEIVSVGGARFEPMLSFRDKIGRHVKLEFRRIAGGPTLMAEVLVMPIRPAAAFSAATGESARIIKRDGRLIGYVHAWSVHSIEGISQAMVKLADLVAKETANKRRDVDALILDMRGRVGGRMDVAESYLNLLYAPARPYWGKTEVTSRNRTGSSPHRDHDAGTQSFRGRTVMLIDANTRSAGEIVAFGFRKARLGTLVGTRTAGAVSGGSVFLMPGDNLLYVAVTGMTFDGVPIEGRGVAPDIIVDRPLAYAAGADPVLERGLDIAARIQSGSAAATQ